MGDVNWAGKGRLQQSFVTDAWKPTLFVKSFLMDGENNIFA
jgi:hypothetical protein